MHRVSSSGAPLRRSSPGFSEDESACWICLEGSSTDRGALSRPCACPRDVHLKCLSRWCLQQAGRSEESNCRFCKHQLPDWKSVLSGPSLPPADPVMVVTLGSVVHKIRVKPGEEGQKEFQQEIRRLFSIPDGVEFEVTFRCKAPCTTDTIQLEGMSSYAAATHCASLMAAQRMAAAASNPTTTNPQPPTAADAPAPAPARPAPRASSALATPPSSALPAAGDGVTPLPLHRSGAPTNVRTGRLGAQSVAAAAAGAMRRVATSVQSAMHALQGSSSSSHHHSASAGQELQELHTVDAAGPAFTSRRRSASIPASAAAAAHTPNHGLFDVPSLAAALPTPATTTHAAGTAADHHELESMDWDGAHDAAAVPAGLVAAAAAAVTGSAAGSPSGSGGARGMSRPYASLHSSPREGRVRRSRRLGLEESLIRSLSTDPAPTSADAALPGSTGQTARTAVPASSLSTMARAVAARRLGRSLVGPMAGSLAAGAACGAGAPVVGACGASMGRVLLASSTGSGMVLDEDVPSRVGAGRGAEEDGEEEVLGSSGKGSSSARAASLRRSPRHHQLGVWHKQR